MSKSFEENYRAEMMKEIPDLWDRIEAGIEQTTATPVLVAEQPMQQKNGNVRKSNKWMKILAIASPALAACLFGMVMIPAALVLLASGIGKHSEMSATDSVAQAAGGSVMYEDAETAYESAEMTEETDGKNFFSIEENGYAATEDFADEREITAGAATEETVTQQGSDAEVPGLFDEVFQAEIIAVTGEEVTLRLDNSLAERLMLQYEVYPLYDTVFVLMLSEENGFVPEEGMYCGIVFEEAVNDGDAVTVRLIDDTEQNE